MKTAFQVGVRLDQVWSWNIAVHNIAVSLNGHEHSAVTMEPYCRLRWNQYQDLSYNAMIAVFIVD